MGTISNQNPKGGVAFRRPPPLPYGFSRSELEKEEEEEEEAEGGRKARAKQETSQREGVAFRWEKRLSFKAGSSRQGRADQPRNHSRYIRVLQSRPSAAGHSPELDDRLPEASSRPNRRGLITGGPSAHRRV